MPGPLGYWRYARSYFDAAEAAHATGGDKLLFPVIYLYGVAIELALKAFLLARGEAPGKVESFKHRLSDLLSSARRRKLGCEIHLTKYDVAAIRVLSDLYGRHPHRLRYFSPGVVHDVPPVEVVRQAAQRLVTGLHGYCKARTLGQR
jgi:hypothetical protein